MTETRWNQKAEQEVRGMNATPHACLAATEQTCNSEILFQTLMSTESRIPNLEYQRKGLMISQNSWHLDRDPLIWTNTS